MGNISKTFWRIEIFSVNPGHILKKCKREKNWGNIKKN